MTKTKPRAPRKPQKLVWDAGWAQAFSEGTWQANITRIWPVLKVADAKRLHAWLSKYLAWAEAKR